MFLSERSQPEKATEGPRCHVQDTLAKAKGGDMKSSAAAGVGEGRGEQVLSLIHI